MIIKIIEANDEFRVLSDDGTIYRLFQHDENPGRRAVTGKPRRKRALQEARAFAGKGTIFEKPQ